MIKPYAYVPTIPTIFYSCSSVRKKNHKRELNSNKVGIVGTNHLRAMHDA